MLDSKNFKCISLIAILLLNVLTFSCQTQNKEGENSLDEEKSIVVMLLDSGCYGENIWIKNDVFRWKANFIY